MQAPAFPRLVQTHYLRLCHAAEDAVKQRDPGLGDWEVHCQAFYLLRGAEGGLRAAAEEAREKDQKERSRQMADYAAAHEAYYGRPWGQ